VNALARVPVMRVMRGTWALLAIGALGCGGAAGTFRAEGPVLKSWTMQPDTCLSAMRRGVFGADLYRRDEREDTELVVIDGGFVLARVPGEDKMVVFSHDDCRVLAIDLHGNGVKVNGVPGIAGSVRLDCARAGVGRVAGHASFTCY
jgi:hypothetical protein